MSQIPDIDRLLAADEANVRSMRKVFDNYSKELPELLNTASELYGTCSRVFGQAISDETSGLQPDSSIVENIQVKFYRGLLLARIGVLYGSAVADFLRMRLTMPLACVRLQCESIALIKLMSENILAAQKWMRFRQITMDEIFLINTKSLQKLFFKLMILQRFMIKHQE